MPTLPSVLWLLATVIFKREALLVIASCAVLLGVGGAGVVWAQAQTKHVSDEAVEPLVRRVQQLEDGGRRHEREEAETISELKRDVAELARDVRELYRVVKDPTRRSDRLEQPVNTDGGR